MPIIPLRLFESRQSDVKQRHICGLGESNCFVDHILSEGVVARVTFGVGQLGILSARLKFLERHRHLGGVDVRTPAALEVRSLRRTPDDGNMLLSVQWKQSIVLEQHDPF